MKVLGLFALLCIFANLSSAMGKKPEPKPLDMSQFPMVATNPFTDPLPTRPGDRDYSVNIRFTNHGVKDIADETIPRLVHAVEAIYSQCDGVRFHVNVLGSAKAPYTTEQDKITMSVDGKMGLGDGFEKFFSKFPNSESTGFIAVHLFDYLDAGGRNAAQQGGGGQDWLGQAFGALFMDNLWEDLRSPQNRAERLSDIGGNTIRLGMDTLKGYEKNDPISHINETDAKGDTITNGWGNPIPAVAYLRYQSSLLAHEMGHILMETQSGGGKYIDHFCPGMAEQCPGDYLMTAGGSGDLQYLDVPKMKKVIGYSPIPKVEPLQCETLKHHPLVKLEN